MPRTPPIFALTKTVWYGAPEAALPKPTLSACSTPESLVKLAPESVERQSPYAPVGAPPASQMSPSVPGSALKRTLPSAGSPVAFAVNVAPPSVDT